MTDCFFCLNCGCPIGISYILAQPTTFYCWLCNAKYFKVKTKDDTEEYRMIMVVEEE